MRVPRSSGPRPEGADERPGGEGRNPRRRPGVLAEALGDEVVLHRPGSGEGHILNATAALLWAHLDGGHDVRDLASLLIDRYPVDDARAVADVRACLDQLAALGLLADR